MKNNILAEVNRVREIMGIALLNEQVIPDDEIIDDPIIESPYIVWRGGVDFYSDKEWKDYNVSSPKHSGINFIGPMTDELGYLFFYKGDDTGVINGRNVGLATPHYPAIGGNMDIPFIEITNRKSKWTGVGDNKRYILSEGVNYIGPQKEGFTYQQPANQNNIGFYDVDFTAEGAVKEAGILDTSGRYSLLLYGKSTGNKLAAANFDIKLREITLLKADGYVEGKWDGKKGYLSMGNYIPRKGGMAWHLSGPIRILPTVGSEGYKDPEPVPDVITIGFDFRANNPFEFDKAGITDKAKQEIADEMLGLFELKDGEGDKLQQYTDKYLKGKEIIINAYSSIDADPDELGGGEYVGPKNCAKRVDGRPTGLRKDYNLCLSQARAEAVAEYLKLEYPEIFGGVIFKPIGHGESNESGNGVFAKFGSAEQKAHQATGRDSTKTDRRFDFSLPGATFKNDVIQ